MNQNPNEFCKIFIVDGEQIIFRKGISIQEEKEVAVIYVNTFKVNSLNTSLNAQEVPIPCCCIKCQQEKFQQITQQYAEAMMKLIDKKTNKEDAFYTPVHRN